MYIFSRSECVSAIGRIPPSPSPCVLVDVFVLTVGPTCDRLLSHSLFAVYASSEGRTDFVAISLHAHIGSQGQSGRRFGSDRYRVGDTSS